MASGWLWCVSAGSLVGTMYHLVGGVDSGGRLCVS